MAKASASKSKTNVKPAATGLSNLLIKRLKAVYWAESELTKTLPQLKEQTTSQELKAALTEHILQTQVHVTRLEDIFSALNEKSEPTKCEAMEGILKQGALTIEETPGGAVKDAAIIGACQTVEHYEIAAYGTMAAYAKVLNEKKVLDILLKTLTEEKKSDQVLSAIADTQLNAAAIK